MSKASKQQRAINLFCSSIGLMKITNIEAALIRAFGEAGKNINDRYNELVNNSNKHEKGKMFPAEQTELYNYMHTSYDLAMMFQGFSDYDLTESSLCWILDNADLLGNDVLDIGCGCGVITCFAAQKYPDKHFTGIDRTENCIKIANEIKENLKLDNVDFICCNASDINKKYDTVLSFRAMHENIGIKRTEIIFKEFDKQIEDFSLLYKDYVNQIDKILNDSGTVIAFERVEPGTDFLGGLFNYNNVGLIYNRERGKLVSCHESDLPENSELVAFCLERGTPLNDEELFDEWSAVAFSNDEKNQTDAMKDYYLYGCAGTLITGYTSYNEEGTQCIKCALYTHKDEKDSFIMYQANAQEKVLNVFPNNRLNEAKDIFEQNMQTDILNGYKIKKLC